MIKFQFYRKIARRVQGATIFDPLVCIFVLFTFWFMFSLALSPPILKSKLETWCPLTPKYCSVHFPARHSPTEHSSVNTIRKSNTNSTTIREGNGNPLHYSCLENPVAREAWWAAVHGATQSRTRLKRLGSCSSSSITICFINCSPNILTFPLPLSPGLHPR